MVAYSSQQRLAVWFSQLFMPCHATYKNFKVAHYLAAGFEKALQQFHALGRQYALHNLHAMIQEL
jgi:hypothetical protein